MKMGKSTISIRSIFQFANCLELPEGSSKLILFLAALILVGNLVSCDRATEALHYSCFRFKDVVARMPSGSTKIRGRPGDLVMG